MPLNSAAWLHVKTEGLSMPEHDQVMIGYNYGTLPKMAGTNNRRGRPEAASARALNGVSFDRNKYGGLTGVANFLAPEARCLLKNSNF